MIEIKEVTRENIAEFLKLPVKIYKNDPEWVHPIDEDEELFFSDSNPCWDNVKKKLFIAIKNKETVGRIAAFIDPFYQKIEKVGYFGCFESINDKEVAKALLNAAEQYIKQNKIKEIWGPIDGNIGHKCGLLLEHEPQIIAPLMNYHPKYYKDLMKSCKLKKLVDTLSYKIDISQVKDKDLGVLFVKVWNILQEFNKWEIKHIKRDKNKRADELVNLALDKKN